MTTFDTAQSPITKAVPTPAPRPAAPSQSGADAQPVEAPSKPSTDQTTLSRETQEASAAQSSPVNFGAWGPSGAETAGSNAVQGNADISGLGTGTLRKGSKGEQVEALQRMLNEKTGGNLEVDGKFGNCLLYTSPSPRDS